jgi:hypothetical protein
LNDAYAPRLAVLRTPLRESSSLPMRQRRIWRLTRAAYGHLVGRADQAVICALLLALEPRHVACGQSDLCCLSGREAEVAGHSGQGLPDDCLDLVGAEAEGRGHCDRQVAELSLPGTAEDRQVD